MNWRSLGVLVLLANAFLVKDSDAVIHDVRGHQYGTYGVRVRHTWTTQSSYAAVRYTLPTVSYWGTNNVWTLHNNNTLTVTNQAGQLLPWIDTPYNQGQINSGHWIQVENPLPGQPFTFVVDWRVTDFATLTVDPVEYQVEFFGHMGTDYTFPTDLIDTLAPQVATSSSEALAAYSGSSVQPGLRGDMERVALLIKGFEARTRSDETYLRASQILAAEQGDCDELTNATCALLRYMGIPARPVLTFILANQPISQSASMPIATDRNFHAIGEYWNGIRWETFEPWNYTNLAPTSQVWLGAAEDLSQLYVVRDPATPVALNNTQFDQTASNNTPNVGVMGDRVLETSLELWARPSPPSLPPSPSGAPRDSIGPGPWPVEVPRGERGVRLLATYPNPASEGARIQFMLDTGCDVSLGVFDVSGRRVRDLVHGFREAGRHDALWDGKTNSGERVPAGVYFYRLEAGSWHSERKLVVVSR